MCLSTSTQIDEQQSKDLAKDPNAFAYDEVYDDIRNERIKAQNEKMIEGQVKREVWDAFAHCGNF